MSPAESRPVREWRDVTRVRFEQDIVPLGKPAVLRGLVNDWACVQQSDTELRSYLVNISNDKPLNTFLAGADTNGLFDYAPDLRGFNFERRQLSLGALLDELELDDGRYRYAGAINVSDHAPDFARDFSNPLLADDVEQLVSLWVGGRTRIPAHWDLPRNIACVVAGQRRFTLFPTSQVPNMYIGPIDVTIAGQPTSLVDPRDPDYERFPKFTEAAKHMQTATLEPGDAIYIPSLWLHHVESLQNFGVLANYWWREGPARFTPLLSLYHSLLSVGGMPQHERDAWRELFDHYVFNGDPDRLAHLPDDSKGVLGDLSPADAQKLRQFLKSRL